MNQHKIAQQPSTVLVNNYAAGEKCYVDFAGDIMEYVDMDIGVIKVQIFVGCLPYTNYVLAICVPSQKSKDFIYAIPRMFVFIGDYSLPYQHIGQKVKVIYTRTLVKVYLKGERIATYPSVEG